MIPARGPAQGEWATPWRAHLLALVCLALVAAIYVWPLLSNLTTAIPGPPGFPDVTEYVWNTGWVRHALTGDDALLYTDALFVPFGADLRLDTLGLLQGLLAFPFSSLLGTVGAYNLILVVTLFLNGATAYTLFHHQVGHTLAAFIAASWFMLAATLLGQLSVGRAALGSLWIVMVSLLVMISLLARPHLWKGLLLGLLLVAALFTDFQILFFCSIWLALYLAYWYWRRRSLGPVLPSLSLAAVTVLAPFLLIFYPALAGAEAAGYPRAGLRGMLVYSFSLVHYVTPRLWWIAAGGYELVATALAAIIIFRRQGAYRFWLAGALVFLGLALGPYLQPTDVPLPFAAFSLWPPLRHFRTPARLTIPATIGLSMVAAIVLAYGLSRVRSSALLLLLALAAVGGRLLFANARTPLQIQTYPQYATYAELAAEPGEFALLEVPFAVRSGLQRIGSGGEVVQYYQHIHGKRLLNGSMARLPGRLFAFYREYPSLLFLAGEYPEAPAQLLADDFADVLDWSGARYVLLHRSLLTPAEAEQIEHFLDRQPILARLHVEKDLVVYRVRATQE